MKLFAKILSLLFLSTLMFGQKQIDVGVDEKLGDYLPMDAIFQNSDGDTLKLGDVINKPILLSLVYYECPGICNPLLTELAWTVDKIDLVPIDDYQVVTISFDHDETPATAQKWKKNYFNAMKKFPEEGWTFLTGDSINIKKVTDALGFYFKKQGNEFLHAGTVVAIAPDGKISRYIFGSTFNQFDLKMALLDAEAGKTNPTIAKVLQFCFSYDPEGRGYTLNITRIAGTIMLLGIGIFLVVLVLGKRKNK